MKLKKGSILYARIDYKVGEKEMIDQDIFDHLTYVQDLAEERFFLGGGFQNVDGGMILFEAENLEEAQKVCQSDPIIESGLYRCDIFEWELFILSEDIEV